MSKTTGQAGQAAVETAIVMPLHLFLLLGVIQFGMISQARYMAKYAAYRAVRIGAMNNANTKMMKAAAVLTLIPVIALPSGTEDPTKNPTEAKKGTATYVAEKLALYDAYDLALSALGLSPVKVVVCGPLSGDVTGLDQQSLDGVGSSNQIDFDDPRVSTEWKTGVANSGASLGAFLRSKLRVQVQFMYEMPIPFANWIISRTYLAMSMPTIMRMSDDSAVDQANDFNPDAAAKGNSSDAGAAYNTIAREIWGMANNSLTGKRYVIPIFESYSMRMQSDFFNSGTNTKLPDKNLCVTYGAFN